MLGLVSPYGLLKALTTICGATALYVLLTALYNVYLHPLRRFPGPWLWRAFRVPWVVSMQKGELHQRMLSFHERYGSIVRIAPNELSFTDPNAWRDIYGNRPGHAVFERNPTWLRKMRPGDPDSIMGCNEDAHTFLRKVFVQAFSEKALKDQSPLIESHIELLIDRFRQKLVAGNGQSILDLVNWFDYLFFDISGDLSFGESFDCVKNGTPHPWVAVCHSNGKGLALISSIGFYPPFSKLLKYIIPEKTRQRMIDHRAMSAKRVRQRLAMDTNRPDFITAVVKNNEEKGNAPSPREMEMNMGVLIFAGAETTAGGASGILRMLLQNPSKLSVLVDEIRSAFEDEHQIEIASVSRLEYLNAVINEGLRLCPPVGVGIPRIAPLGGETVCNELIAENTYVTLNQYPAFRSPQNFSRPSEFLPERFLRSVNVVSKDDMAAFLPFQTGRHSCIGQRLALAELRLLFARLLFNFDIELADAHDIWDWGEQKTFIFWEKRPLRCVLKLAG